MSAFVQRFKLRNYQIESINKILKYFEYGKNNILLCLPTGTGKTIVFIEIIRQLIIQDNSRRCLILVHRDELIKQTFQKFKTLCKDISIGVVKAEENELHNQITLASVQTMASEKRLKQIQSQTILVIDEAHHACAASYQKIISHLRELNPNIFHLGCTATPFRSDKKSLNKIYSTVAYQKSILEMISAGWLSPVVSKQIMTNLNLDSVKASRGDFIKSQLSAVVNTSNQNNLIMETYKNNALERKTIAYCVDTKHAEDLNDVFNENGIPSKVILGKTDLDTRSEIYKKFRRGGCLCHLFLRSINGWF